MPLEQPIAALDWNNNDNLFMAAWNGNGYEWQFERPAVTSLGTLGKNSKERAEAANWSADCPLIKGLVAEPMTEGTES